MNQEQPQQLGDLSHHERFEYCSNRPLYRKGRKLTAVKVYTLIDESRHLLVFGVPKVNLHQEVRRLFEKFGKIQQNQMITNEIAANNSVAIEQFTDCYHIVFAKIHCARRAKHVLDRKNFYGGILHISYAPEYETIDELNEKFFSRKNEIGFRLRKMK